MNKSIVEKYKKIVGKRRLTDDEFVKVRHLYSHMPKCDEHSELYSCYDQGCFKGDVERFLTSQMSFGIVTSV